MCVHRFNAGMKALLFSIFSGAVLLAAVPKRPVGRCERLGSGDGEEMTMKTRQTASEPLPASRWFWTPCSRLPQNKSQIDLTPKQ